MELKWEVKEFKDLTTLDLYKILALRCEVFVVEQNCPYQDCDNKDLKSMHLLGFNNDNELLAYMRILPQNISYPEISMGRIVTSPKVRSTGLGKELMLQGLQFTHQLFSNQPIRISAQSHLEKFYNEFGFISTGKHYLEDNIPHTEMLRN